MTSIDIQQVREKIESDLEWRLDEIAFFSNQLNSFRLLNISESEKRRVSNEKRKYRKLLVLILYSHFEGFFRFAFSLFVETLNNANIELSKVIDVLAVSSLQKTFLEYEKSKSNIELDSSIFNKTNKRLEQRVKFLDELSNMQKGGFLKLPISSNHLDKTSVIYTESNLSPEVFEKILFRLGFDNTLFGLGEVELKKTLNEFLQKRHGIAHGDGKFKDGVEDNQYLKYKSAFDKIVKIIPIAIHNALNQKTFLKPEHRL